MPQQADKKEKTIKQKDADVVMEMFNVGAHFGYRKSKRHPSTSPYIFGIKNNTEIFDLEKTEKLLEEAKSFVEELARNGKTLLFVGGKHSAWEPVKANAERVGAPYVTGRWVGGTITNFSQIKKRIERLIELEQERDTGELSRKYTKKEQLLTEREIKDLDEKFGGMREMNKIPDAVYIVDPRKEAIAVREAKKKEIPIVVLASSDCNIHDIDCPITANDAAISSIEYFTERIADAYQKGKREAE